MMKIGADAARAIDAVTVAMWHPRSDAVQVIDSIMLRLQRSTPRDVYRLLAWCLPRS